MVLMKKHIYPQIGLESRATESVRSEVRNLREADPSVDWEGLVYALSMAYLGDSPKQVNCSPHYH